MGVQLTTDKRYVIYNIQQGKLPSLNEINQDTELLLAVLCKPHLELLDLCSPWKICF